MPALEFIAPGFNPASMCKENQAGSRGGIRPTTYKDSAYEELCLTYTLHSGFEDFRQAVCYNHPLREAKIGGFGNPKLIEFMTHREITYV
jgi:hypothetical protein